MFTVQCTAMKNEIDKYAFVMPKNAVQFSCLSDELIAEHAW